MFSQKNRLRPLCTTLFSALLIVAINLTGFATAEARDTSIPTATKLQQVVDEAHAKYKDLKDGKNADYRIAVRGAEHGGHRGQRIRCFGREVGEHAHERVRLAAWIEKESGVKFADFP